MNREEHPIDIRGKKLIITEIRGRIGKKDKARVEEFVYAILGYFNVGKRLRRSVEVDVQFVDTLEKGSVLGYCWGDKSDIRIQLARRYVKSNRKGAKKWPLNERDLFMNIAHEVVHAKQFIFGEINLTNSIYRKGEYKFDCQLTEYRQQPWEVEAYGLEDVLTHLYYDREWED
jgi:hypothetical protein